MGIPPNRENPSSTETAQAAARVDTVITHPDGTFSEGGREFENQVSNPIVGGDFDFGGGSTSPRSSGLIAEMLAAAKAPRPARACRGGGSASVPTEIVAWIRDST